MPRAKALTALMLLFPVGALWPTAPAWAQRPPPPANGAQAGANGETDWITIQDPAAGRLAQKAAANRLLLASDPNPRERIDQLIRSTPGADAARDRAREVLLQAIATTPIAPAWLVDPLVAALRALPAEASTDQLAAALGSVRVQASARALIDAASAPGVSRTNRLACTGALRRLTGRSELRDDPRAWAEWFTGVEFLPEAEWRRVLWEGLAARADEVVGTATAAVARLVDAKRREFLDLPAEGRARPDLLAGLLVDQIASLRRLGIELVKRELANGRVPDQAVVDATVELLGDPSPEFRAASADLLGAIAPPGAGRIVADALSRERDPIAAGAMLVAASRAPNEQVRSAALEWLTSGNGARLGAVEALAALVRAGMLPDPEDRRRVAAILGAIDPQAMSDSSVWLLVQTGSAEQRAQVAVWLKHPALPIRVRAAAALAAIPEGLEPLLAAASDDPNLFAAAALGIGKYRSNAEGLRTLAGLPAPSAEARATALVAASVGTPAGDLVRVCREIEPAATREAMLVRLAAQAGKSTMDADMIAGVVLLAQTRLAQRQPARTLDALDALDAAGVRLPPIAAVEARATALVWLNRLEDAQKIDAPPVAWLDGLERALALPHARTIVATIRTRFQGKLSPTEQSRLDILATGLSAESVVPPEGG